eukprot:CAMPEP_0169092544 /NCGR_PEP_ID=MMETSP1015-20121227/16961_1 /TAXON_ID=342587 /ORGANISM="Karlodinium micrum, Strain CCMP2283" /LENGTH=69 /DNA_ID=CAMNT_0009153127 /DNA_START=168 /DNA_END=374 /DNA_ORIENTATION=-
MHIIQSFSVLGNGWKSANLGADPLLDFMLLAELFANYLVVSSMPVMSAVGITVRVVLTGAMSPTGHMRA